MAELKRLARRIFNETLAAIDIPSTMRRKLACEGTILICGPMRVDLRAFEDIRVVAIGKAAHAMVEGLAGSLPAGFSFEGIGVAPVTPAQAHPGMKYFVGGHPIPNAESWRAGEAILEMLAGCDARTMVFFLLSGGGSALVEVPLDRTITLSDVQQMYGALVSCGAPIEAMNTVRRHFSAVKGGRLAAAAGLATKITLAVSDVPAGKEWALASGPTLPDATVAGDVGRVLQEYALGEKFPDAVRRWFSRGNLPETLKAADAAFRYAHFVLLLGMHELFHPAHGASEGAGFMTCCDNATDDWPVVRAAEYLLEQLEEMQRNNPGRRVAVIADGEVSSPVTGDGVGGRNAAFVLACVERIAGRRVALLSAGTDGIDGNSPAAGAVADGETLERARAAGLDVADAFRRSDAYTFFARLDDAVMTGPTGNNLRDFRILISEPELASVIGRAV
jgi:glycerate 2-kinase